MSDSKPSGDQNQMPEDVATLYSWANLHGAKYRDFSASRALTREKARVRAEQAVEDEQQRIQEAAEAAQAEAERAADEARVAEQARQAEIAAAEAARQQEEAAQRAKERAAQEAREQAARRLAQQAAEQIARMEAEQAARQAAHEAAERATQLAVQRAQEQAAQLAARQEAEQAAHEAAERTAQLAIQQAQEQAAQLAARQEAEQAAYEAAERTAQLAIQQAQEQAAQLVAQQEAEQAARQVAHEAAERATQLAVQRAQEQAAQLAARQEAEKAAQQRTWQPPRTDRIPEAPPPPPPAYTAAQSFDYAGFAHTQAYRPASAQPPLLPVRDQAPAPARLPWAAPEVRESMGRPAWLSTESQPTAPAQQPQAPLPQSPEDTLQGSCDRLASRWFALRNVFDPVPPQPEPVPAPAVSRAPSMAVFSLAGGVGKTSLVATLGRALSASGERVLLVDTAAFGLLPFFFGATDQRPGQLRTFNPPGVSSDAPIQMVTIDPEGLSPEQGDAESLSGEIAKFARGASRILVDVATASGATTRRIMRMAPLVLVPVVADMNSVVSVSSIDAFFEHNNIQGGKAVLPYYVLNQFDATLPLHLDVREVLREQLGERLLPFTLRRAPAMSEALAEGMTVMDYAPGSALAEDFATLAGWVKSLSAPATTSYRGVRWSER